MEYTIADGITARYSCEDTYIMVREGSNQQAVSKKNDPVIWDLLVELIEKAAE